MVKKTYFAAGQDSSDSEQESSGTENRKRDKSSEADDREEPIQKKPKVKKPLPEGYICKACGVAGEHAIYDCPNKVVAKKAKATSQETNQNEESQIKSRNKSNVGEKYTCYISGLPFTTSKSSFTKLVAELGYSGDLSPQIIKLLMFEDNPTKCRGIGYVSFTSQTELDNLISCINGKSVGKVTINAEDCTGTAPVDKKQKSKKGKGCYRCGKDHDPATCTNDRICYRCKSTEHLSSACPWKKSSGKISSLDI